MIYLNIIYINFIKRNEKKNQNLWKEIKDL